jgi:hypothetical protein
VKAIGPKTLADDGLLGTVPQGNIKPDPPIAHRLWNVTPGIDAVAVAKKTA